MHAAAGCKPRFWWKVPTLQAAKNAGATIATEPAPVGGGAAVWLRLRFYAIAGSIVAFGVRLPATSAPRLPPAVLFDVFRSL